MPLKSCVICGVEFESRRKTCSPEHHKQHYNNNARIRAREYQRRQRAKNPELVRAKLRAWKQANPERHAENKRRSYFNNLETSKTYRKTHKEQIYEHNRAAFHKRRGAGDFDKDAWNKKLALLNYQCVYCGSKDRIEIDHIYPISKGGTNHIDNLQPLCAFCNNSKHNKILIKPMWQFTHLIWDKLEVKA